MSLRKSSIAFILGSAVYIIGLTGMALTEKPELLEQKLEDYSIQEKQYNDKIDFYGALTMLSIIPLYAGGKKDWKNLCEYFNSARKN